MASPALKVPPVFRVAMPVAAPRRQARTPVCPHPQALHELCAGAVDAAILRTARRFRLSADEAADLRSELWLKISARQGRLVRRFRGQASIETYLASVAHNLLLDQRNHLWGRWRPCLAARQHGRLGVLIDRLIRRDGLTEAEAESWLRAAYPHADLSVLPSLCEQLRVKPRRTFVDAEFIDDYRSQRPVDLRAQTDAARGRQFALRQLRRALQSLSPADRLLLVRRYAHGATVASLAEDGSRPAKPIYRRCEQLLRAVRHTLERGGVTRESIHAWIGASNDHEIAV